MNQRRIAVLLTMLARAVNELIRLQNQVGGVTNILTSKEVQECFIYMKFLLIGLDLWEVSYKESDDFRKTHAIVNIYDYQDCVLQGIVTGLDYPLKRGETVGSRIADTTASFIDYFILTLKKLKQNPKFELNSSNFPMKTIDNIDGQLHHLLTEEGDHEFIVELCDKIASYPGLLK